MRGLFSCLLAVLLALGTAASLPAQTGGEEECDPRRAYCVEALNSGLPAPSTLVDRETPRAAIESMIFLAERGAWAQAAHLLDLSQIPTARQSEIGPDLAEQFEAIISRKAVIDWDTLIDRPDAIDARAATDAPLAGEPRRSLLLWTFDLDSRPAAIRLSRIHPQGGEPVWVFSSQTVQNIPELYDRYGPSAFEDWIPDALKVQAGFGFVWWEVLGLPILLGLALLGGRLSWRLLDWIAYRTDRDTMKTLTKTLRGPVATGVATGTALLVASQVFVFSGQITTILTPLAWLGLMGSVLWLTINGVEVLLDNLIRFEDEDLTRGEAEANRTKATRIAATRRALVVVVSLIGGGIFLAQTNLFQNLGLTLLGTAGALTLILGFAARRVLGNIMSSMQIALNQSAKIGDRIVYDGYLCHVERINFTYVQLRDWDGTRLVVPVEEFASTPFENWTMQEPEMLRIIKLKFAQTADVDKLREAFEEVVAELDQNELGDLDKMLVRVAEQDVFGKDVWFALPCRDPNTSWDLACLAREGILSAAARIEKDAPGQIFTEVNPSEAA